MRRLCFALACTMFLPGARAVAQFDPISGSWAGDAGLSLTQRTPIKLELKLDATGKVSGTLTGPGAPELKAGTFDTTTGALRLEVGLNDGNGAAVFIFEGTAIDGMATGKVNDGTRIGSFRITKSSGGAPAGPRDDVALALQKGFTEVSTWVSKAAELVPAAKYSYQPVKTVRSYGQLVAHVADSYNYYCAQGAGKKVEWSDAIEKGATDKATVTAKLAQALQGCNAAYAGKGEMVPLLTNVGHTNLHYGNIITYLRMMGLVPPSS